MRYVLDAWGWMVRVRARSRSEAAEKLLENVKNLPNSEGDNRV